MSQQTSQNWFGKSDYPPDDQPPPLQNEWFNLGHNFLKFLWFSEISQKIQSFQSLGLANKKLPLAYSALLCFKEIWVFYEKQ